MLKTYFLSGSVLIVAAALTGSACLAQSPSSTSEDAPTTSWQSDSVVYIAGLPVLKQNVAGSLRLGPENLVFANRDTEALIPLSEITSVSIGDERVATGGGAAKVGRMIPVFGIGAAMGAVTSKTVDLLSIEYRNSVTGYHGVVFEVPKTQAKMAQDALMPFTRQQPEPVASQCTGEIAPKSLLIAPIESPDLELPAEYRVLLYEQLLAESRKAYTGGTVLRVGDTASSCASKTLHASITAFKKGNEKLRSSTGPVGLFVGGTSVAITVRLVDNDGSVVFEKTVKGSKHGDSESLNVTRDVAHSVAKRLTKANWTGASDKA